MDPELIYEIRDLFLKGVINFNDVINFTSVNKTCFNMICAYCEKMKIVIDEDNYKKVIDSNVLNTRCEYKIVCKGFNQYTEKYKLKLLQSDDGK